MRISIPNYIKKKTKFKIAKYMFHDHVITLVKNSDRISNEHLEFKGNEPSLRS